MNGDGFSPRGPSSVRSTNQLAEARILEWQAREEAANRAAKVPLAPPASKTQVKNPKGEQEFDEREKPPVEDDEEGE